MEKKKIIAPSWAVDIKSKDYEEKLDKSTKNEDLTVINLEEKPTAKLNKEKILEVIEGINKSDNINTDISEESLSDIKLNDDFVNKNVDYDQLKSVLGKESIFKEEFRTKPTKNEQSILDLILLMTNYDGITDEKTLAKEAYYEQKAKKEAELKEQQEKEIPKPEPKPQPKPQPKPEPKSEPKPEPKPEININKLEDDGGKNILEKEEPKVEKVDENLDLELPDIDISLEFTDEDSKTYSLKELNDKYSLSPDTQI